jgi:hypothetical protein
VQNLEKIKQEIKKLEVGKKEYRAQRGLNYQNFPLMAEIPSSEYLHRSIDQLRSMNERGINDYKPFTGLRNNIVTDYTIKANLNNNNNLIDNRNTTVNNQSPNIGEQKHQHYSVPSTPPTPLSITEAQMNDAKVRQFSRRNKNRAFSQRQTQSIMKK